MLFSNALYSQVELPAMDSYKNWNRLSEDFYMHPSDSGLICFVEPAGNFISYSVVYEYSLTGFENAVDDWEIMFPDTDFTANESEMDESVGDNMIPILLACAEGRGEYSISRFSGDQYYVLNVRSDLILITGYYLLDR